MADPFISEIRIFGFGWPPRGWAQCDGQLMPISQNSALYSLIGTTYGGDGRVNFALPDMRGRIPVSFGSSNNDTRLGEQGGIEFATLSEAEMPGHSHQVRGTTSDANTKFFTSSVFASAIDKKTSQATNVYGPATDLVALNAESVTYNGGGGSHNNIQPSEVVNFCIALEGAFPSRN